MSVNPIDDLPAGKLRELLDIFAKNWLAMDGVWFQSIERKFGMDEAMFHDIEAWRRFTVIEAGRIKTFLGLPDNAGLEGLAKALAFRFYALLNKHDISIDGDTLLYKVQSCRVQVARKRKGMEYHPCKSVGIVEYSGFAKAIDERIAAECVSCYPDVTDESCNCVWKFTLA